MTMIKVWKDKTNGYVLVDTTDGWQAPMFSVTPDIYATVYHNATNGVYLTGDYEKDKGELLLILGPGGEVVEGLKVYANTVRPSSCYVETDTGETVPLPQMTVKGMGKTVYKLALEGAYLTAGDAVGPQIGTLYPDGAYHAL